MKEEFKKKLIESFVNLSKSGKLIFFVLGFLGIIINISLFLYNPFGNNQYREYINKYSQFLDEVNLVFKSGLEIEFIDGTYKINSEEPKTFINNNKNLSTKTNFLYIKKDASYEDFKTKDTLLILNEKEIALDLEPEPLVYPLESFRQNNMETIKLNENVVSSYIKNFKDNGQAENIGINIITVFNTFEIFFYYLLAVFVTTNLASLILNFTGYQILNKTDLIKYSLYLFGSYFAIKSLMENLISLPGILNLTILITVIVSILVKRKIENTFK